MAKLKTGRHTSALKEARKTVKRTARNSSVKSSIRTAVKKVEDLIKKKDVQGSLDALRNVFSVWDKASKRNIVHKKAASNQKARLSKKVSAISK
ncbi:MAG: 30S ribosomal protein S20 [Elusimicrobiota bacterium]|jgi:small subunit ribosomal protein S20|nr:30S ribosomal protein S20 [Elusimicrobiota bacterium]